MVLLRVDARALVPRLRAELAALLTGLTGGDWGRPTACPGWSVHDVAAHLLGVELGNVSVRRDRWGLGPAEGEDLDAWLNRFNQQWVDAARRISPALLIVTFTAEGEGGGSWHVVRAAAGSELAPAPPARAAACQARTTAAGALKLYARDPSAPSLTWQGDREIAGALAGVKAVLG